MRIIRILHLRCRMFDRARMRAEETRSDLVVVVVKVLAFAQHHRHLGRLICMNVSWHIDVEISHRIRVAWGKFRKYRE